MEKLSNYDGLHNALIREAIEINIVKDEMGNELCNDIAHVVVDSRWC